MAGEHDFVVVIPVADRPRHLADCLHSLLELLRQFPYPGSVSVLVADDSRDPDSLVRHRDLAEDLSGQGLPTHYLSQAEQRSLIEALPAGLRRRLAGVIGDHGPAAFHHKGASVTRNLAYLWLHRLQRDGGKRLFWFIDSDQEFRVSVATATGEVEAHGLDYFHWLDRIFRETPARILTGKVVGDPPVSPAVMAGTCLDDVEAFLERMAGLVPGSACSFHGEAGRTGGDAAYHDMAELFGFQPAATAWRYRCPLPGAHDHAACFADFTGRLDHFFDGEHPTRRSLYRADDPLASLQPARTVYTGNYVFGPAGLTYFIPFADLKLRMAGPTLGRIIRAELGAGFVAANLPMLHTRAQESLGRSEFRPGLARERDAVDLSGEFERQYFGDVMLFSVERLAAAGYPGTRPDPAAILAAVEAVDAQMHDKYGGKHAEVAGKLERLQARFDHAAAWWHREPGLDGARADLRRFLGNMQGNFGNRSRAWAMLDDTDHRQARKSAIAAAISRYPVDREAWREALGWS